MPGQFEELYEKYHQDLFSFLYYLVNSREQAEDLLQEVYIRIFKSYGTFQGKSSEKTWLFSIARHVAIDSFRKNSGWKKRIIISFDWNKNEFKDLAPLPEEISIQNEQIHTLYSCLDKCSIDYRLVLILRYIHSMSISETAVALEWSESKVKTTQHRALKKIKKLMEEVTIGEKEFCDKHIYIS
ncbi:RNA polymerase sigma factor SigX [Neobacillus drentensis]|uniref:RNA polymerase sigma factor SigX n=1 Tax=Neobacillus drentensis TaxID=220684 RepID=UPI002FFE4A35